MLALALLAMGLLAGCAFPPPAPSDRDDVKYTRSEQCTRACNRDYDICGAPADTHFESYGEPRHIIGMSAMCDANLKDCLKRCSKQ